MKSLFFCVFDSAAAMYLEPFSAPTVEVAMRGFKEVVNKVGHQFHLYPSDYTLFSIGEFDMETGNLLPHNPVSLGVGITFVEKMDIVPLDGVGS